MYRYQAANSSKQKMVWLVRRPKGNLRYKGNLGWGMPKGWIDKGESSQMAAIREVKEEGGVEAKIVGKLDNLKVFFKDEKGELVMKTITYYLMEWDKDCPEEMDDETEEVRWVTLKQGLEMLAYANEKKLLEKVGEMVGN